MSRSLIALLLTSPTLAAAADLDPVPSFGANPGALAMYEHVPADLPPGAPLVVVLHGCTQTARDMLAARWNELADEVGFAVVYAEQSTANNPLRCFNWAGEYGDLANLRRGEGENRSILSMIDHAIATHDVDPSRVYVTGFSAGGAFTAVMLATWPDRIAAGAVQAGVPYRCAEDVNTAYACQALDLNPDRDRTPEQWAALVEEAAGGHRGPWPRVAIWHGTADAVVDAKAGDELVEQWTAVHGVDSPTTATIGGHERARWGGGAPVVERWTIDGMGHAVALGAADPDGGCAATAAYYEDVGLCSTRRIAAFFGLLGGGDGGGDGDGDGHGGGGDGSGDGDGHGGGGGGCGAGGGHGGGALALIAAAAALRSRARRARRG